MKKETQILSGLVSAHQTEFIWDIVPFRGIIEVLAILWFEY